jgi:hypothetical protein
MMVEAMVSIVTWETFHRGANPRLFTEDIMHHASSAVLYLLAADTRLGGKRVSIVGLIYVQ